MPGFVFILLCLLYLVNAGSEIKRILSNSKYPNALCLDGSQGGYYTRLHSNSQNWLFFFQGGGFCYNDINCLARSKTDLGSSINWPDHWTKGGIGSDNCLVNPVFCNYNVVFMRYCDGNAFSGNRDEPVIYEGTKLYHRGFDILNSIFKDIYDLVPAFAKAKKVMLSGCSAGGLAAFLHADYVRTLMPSSVSQYGVLPISGYLLNHANIDGYETWVDLATGLFEMSNSTAGLPFKCISSFPSQDHYKCSFAPIVYNFIESPIFVVNSVVDIIQMSCMFAGKELPPTMITDTGNCNAFPLWRKCISDISLESCTDSQMVEYNKFGLNFLDTIFSSHTIANPTNGGFLSTCITHCETCSDKYFNSFVLEGKTIQQAISDWWLNGFQNGPLWYKPCELNTNSHPRQCNPSCKYH